MRFLGTTGFVDFLLFVEAARHQAALIEQSDHAMQIGAQPGRERLATAVVRVGAC